MYLLTLISLIIEIKKEQNTCPLFQNSDKEGDENFISDYFILDSADNALFPMKT